MPVTSDPPASDLGCKDDHVAQAERRPSKIQTPRLVLTPLEVENAAEMVAVLGDKSLYEYTGGAPPDEATLTARYQAQTAGPSSGGEQWFNWIVRLAVDAQPIGFVQATVAGRTADVAWLIGSDWQCRGYGTEASRAMIGWLRKVIGVTEVTAHIHPAHTGSQRVAAALGLAPTRDWKGGEQVWRRLT